MKTRGRKRRVSVAEYEEAALGAPAQVYVLRLFVSGGTSASVEAIENTTRICEEYLPGRYELEVIDIYQQPAAVASEQIVVAPTLVKKFPPPLRRLVGNLSDTEHALRGLSLGNRKG